MDPEARDRQAQLEAEIEWLARNQTALEQRIERVEYSVVFRALRTAGGIVRRYRRRVAHALDPAGKRGIDHSEYRRWLAARERAGDPPAQQWSYEPKIGIIAPGEQPKEDAEYTAFVDAGDRLSPWARYRVTEALQRERYDLIYTDEDRNGAPLFKPDWSPVLREHCEYVGGLAVISTERLKSAGGDFEAALRTPGLKVKHIPEILYFGHGEAPQSNTPVRAKVEGAPVSIVICSRTPRLLRRCLEALRRNTGYSPLQFVVVRHDTGDGEVSRQMEKIAATFGCKTVVYSGSFNFAEMNNRGVAAASGEVLVFLNDDVVPLAPEWLASMVEWLRRPEVGAVGARLLYPDGTIQHAGIALAITDGAGHPGRFTYGSPYWPWLGMTREVTAVTGACLAMRRDVFDGVGGFDPEFAVNYNDVDLCLRIRRAGYHVIFDARAALRHDESQTRTPIVRFEERRRFFQRWPERLTQMDPYYNPNLSRDETVSLSPT